MQKLLLLQWGWDTLVKHLGAPDITTAADLLRPELFSSFLRIEGWPDAWLTTMLEPLSDEASRNPECLRQSLHGAMRNVEVKKSFIWVTLPWFQPSSIPMILQANRVKSNISHPLLELHS